MVQADTTEAKRNAGEAAPDSASPRDAFVAARRQEILDAARRAFIARGFDATSMQQIAAESGVSAGNIYRYFSSKEELIGAVIEGCDGEARQMFADTAAATHSANEALTALGDEVWAKIPTLESREQSMLGIEALLVAVRNPEVGDASKRNAQTIINGLTDLVRGAQADGEIDAELDTGGLATLLYGLVLGVQQLQLQLGDDADPATVWATQQQLLEPFVHLNDAE